MESAEQRAKRLSGLYYNMGLDRAQIRDLSGAVDKLQARLWFDKSNTPARNLLGLVYFETGEVVAALSEWIISQNLDPENNPASDFIGQVRADQGRLQTIGQSIRGYNEALASCREGNEDIAAIRLRRVLNQNTHLIKAYHLLALIEIRQGKLAHARRILRRAARIDRTNPTTLRYLQEISVQSGKTGETGEGWQDENTERTLQKISFRQSSLYAPVLNLLLGLTIGLLAGLFLIAPAARQSINRKADERIIEYTETMAAQEVRISTLTNEVDEARTEAANTKKELEDAINTPQTYQNLIRAMKAYQEQNYAAAGDALQEVNRELLTYEAKQFYDSAANDIRQAAYQAYASDGDVYFYQEDYRKALESYKKAYALDSSDYNLGFMIANTYENLNDTDSAMEQYRELLQKFPDSEYAEYMVNRIQALGGDITEYQMRQAGTDETGDQYTDGYTDEYTDGYTEGYEENTGGYTDGYTEENTDGYTEENTDGYLEG